MNGTIKLKNKSFQFENRNPGPEDIEDMVTLLPDLRDSIVAASNVTKLRRILSNIQYLRRVKGF